MREQIVHGDQPDLAMLLEPSEALCAAQHVEERALGDERDLGGERRGQLRHVAGSKQRGQRQLGESGGVALAPDGNDQAGPLTERCGQTQPPIRLCAWCRKSAKAS